MRMTILPQSATNSVPQLVRIVTKFLVAHLQDWAQQSIDHLAVKKPKTRYNNVKATLGIRRYILEHIENLNAVLANLKRAGVILTFAKSQFCRARIMIIGFICEANRSHLDTSKVWKIIGWPTYTDITTAWALMRVFVYYQIWIESFARIATLIYHLCKKNISFQWRSEQIEAINLLKDNFTSPAAFVPLDNFQGVGDIFWL